MALWPPGSPPSSPQAMLGEPWSENGVGAWRFLSSRLFFFCLLGLVLFVPCLHPLESRVRSREKRWQPPWSCIRGRIWGRERGAPLSLALGVRHTRCSRAFVVLGETGFLPFIFPFGKPNSALHQPLTSAAVTECLYSVPGSLFGTHAAQSPFSSILPNFLYSDDAVLERGVCLFDFFPPLSSLSG